MYKKFKKLTYLCLFYILTFVGGNTMRISILISGLSQQVLKTIKDAVVPGVRELSAELLGADDLHDRPGSIVLEFRDATSLVDRPFIQVQVLGPENPQILEKMAGQIAHYFIENAINGASHIPKQERSGIHIVAETGTPRLELRPKNGIRIEITTRL